MGADICMAFLAAPRDLNLSDNREAALNCLNQIEEEYKKALGDAEDESEEAEERLDKWYEEHGEDVLGVELHELTRHSVENALDNVRFAIDCLTESSGRDVGWLEFGEYRLWYTGGMSWGDIPTTSYDWFHAIDGCVPVSKALGLTWP